VNVFEAITHRRDAEVAEIRQSKIEIRAPLSRQELDMIAARRIINSLSPSLVISKESLSMKSSRPLIQICAALAIVFTAGLWSIGHAQNREKFGISARAGGVNAVSGHVMVKREGQAPQLLTNQDDLVAGDLVTTGSDSQAEILLYPGSYLRLAENSELVLSDNSLSNLLVTLNRGSAIIEASGADDTKLQIGIATDQRQLMIVRRGIYRINALRGSTELLVQKGRAFPVDDPAQLIKGGKKVTFSGHAAFTARLDKSDRDKFDIWSKERGQALARANDKLSSRTLSDYLFFRTWGSTAEFSGREGLWAFNPFLRCYTFLPFRYGWSSPYGFFYGQYVSPFGYFPSGGRRSSQPVIVRNPPSSGDTSGRYPSGSAGTSNPSWPGVNDRPVMRPPSQSVSPKPDRRGGRPGDRIDR
jgi:hypothetical protein